MGLIQDVKPPGMGSGWPARPTRAQMVKGRDAALQQIKKFHQATIIPTPTTKPSKTVTGTSATVGKGRYDSFRPHPLLTKHHEEVRKQPEPLQRNLKPDILPPPRHHPAVQAPPRPEQPVRPPRPESETLTTPHAQPVTSEVPEVIPGTRHKIFDFVQYPLIAAAALGAALSIGVGQILIGIFLIVAIITKTPSKAAFVGSLVLLICIPFFQVINLSGTSQNAAVYAFEMLIVGTILATIELWKDGRMRRRRVEPHA